MKRRGDAKRHLLEEPLLGFFNWVWKVKDKLHERSLLLNVPFPETIIYEHHFPRGWFGNDGNGNITKKSAKDCDTTSIYQSFSKAQKNGCDIVACFCYQNEEANNNLRVDFLDVKALGAFLLKPPEKGLLQKFLLPNGKHNDGMWVTWTPFIFFAERWQNKHVLDDVRIPLNDRARVLSVVHCNAVCCAPRIKQNIRDFCKEIVSECFRTEKKIVSKMHLHFKLDKNMQIWLLRAPTITISDAQVSKVDLEDPKVKPNDTAVLKQLRLKGLHNGPVKVGLTRAEIRWYRKYGVPTDFSSFKSMQDANRRKERIAELMKEKNPIVIGRELSVLTGDDRYESGQLFDPETPMGAANNKKGKPDEKRTSSVPPSPGNLQKKKGKQGRPGSAASAISDTGSTSSLRSKLKVQAMMSHEEILADIHAPFRNKVITPLTVTTAIPSQRSLNAAAAADFLDSPGNKPVILPPLTELSELPPELVGEEFNKISESLSPTTTTVNDATASRNAIHLKRSQAYLKVQQQHKQWCAAPDKGLLRLAQSMGIDIGSKHVKVEPQATTRFRQSTPPPEMPLLIEWSDEEETHSASEAESDDERLLLTSLDNNQQKVYHEIKDVHNALNDYMADLAYKAYSHILETDEPFQFSLPPEMVVDESVIDESLLNQLDVKQLDDNLYQMEAAKGTSLVVLTKRLKELSNAVASTLVHQRKELLLQADQLGLPIANSSVTRSRPSSCASRHRAGSYSPPSPHSATSPYSTHVGLLTSPHIIYGDDMSEFGSSYSATTFDNAPSVTSSITSFSSFSPRATQPQPRRATTSLVITQQPNGRRRTLQLNKMRRAVTPGF